MIRVEELPACNVGCRVSLAFHNGLKYFLKFIHSNLGLRGFWFLKKTIVFMKPHCMRVVKSDEILCRLRVKIAVKSTFHDNPS